MAYQLFQLPRVQPFGSGVYLPGSKLNFFLAGTTTPTPVYTTSALSIAHSQPVVADAAGTFSEIYLDSTIAYKATLSNSADVLQYTSDPVNDSILSQSIIGRYLYPQTTAETAGSVTPTDYSYPPGDIRRYGALTASSDNTAAIQAAVNQFAQGGSAVFVPAGTWVCTGTVTGTRGMQWFGDGQYVSILHYTGSSNFLTFTGTLGNPDGGKLTFSDLTFKGSSSSLALVSLVTAGQIAFNRVRFWLSNDSLVKLATECHEVTFLDCQFRSWKKHAVEYSGLNSIQNFIGTNVFNIVGGDAITQNAGSSCIYFGDGEQFNVRGCNVNGDTTLNHFVRFGATNAGPEGNTRGDIVGNYCERLAGSAIKSDSTVIAHGLYIARNNVSTADSIAIDLSSGNPAHRNIHIEANRRAETTACFVASLGSGVIDFLYDGILLSGSAAHLVGFTGQIRVKKFADGTYHVGSQTRSTVGPFSFDNVSGTIGNTDMTGVRWVAPRAGRVTAVVVKATEARTAGTLTVNVFKNTGLSGATGSAMGVSADLDGTNTISKATTTNVIDSTRSFDAGDELYIRYSTSGWTPTTSDIRAFIEVEM